MVMFNSFRLEALGYTFELENLGDKLEIFVPKSYIVMLTVTTASLILSSSKHSSREK